MINERGTESLKENFSNYHGERYYAFDLENALYYDQGSVFRSDLDSEHYAKIYRLVESAKNQALLTYLNGSMVVDLYEFKPNMVQKIVMKIFKIG